MCRYRIGTGGPDHQVRGGHRSWLEHFGLVPFKEPLTNPKIEAESHIAPGQSDIPRR